jgi:hypothetical protein
MLATSHHRPASRTSRRSFGLLVCFALASLVLLILSPRARAEHSAADTVAGLTASATHTVSTAAQNGPAVPSAPTTASSPSAARPTPTPVAGGRPIAVAVPTVATPSDVAATAHTTLDRTTAGAGAAAGHVVAPTHASTRPISAVTGLAGRVTSATGHAPQIVAGGASTVVHTVVHATAETPAAGVLIHEVARSAGTVTGTVEHVASQPTRVARVTLPAVTSPVLAAPHTRAIPQVGGLTQLRQPIAPTAAGQPAATALQALPALAESVIPAALGGPGITSSPAGPGAASGVLATAFAATLQPAPYALLTGYGASVPLQQGAHDNAPSAPSPAHPAPAAPPGGLAPGATSGIGGGLTTSTFLALVGLLMLAMPGALRRLRLLTEPSLPAPFALISARPG